ncbi:TetR/AcrR family transcriptional regulator [Actinosynnema pretiosum subsp. pretiosum]|uniref:TetR/AcrR family transcriptional regulator n=1 Tax=Actinosynnema pretiosum subsp. pretiosum TaxID=103721 RepID=A0AA45L3H1_9PSEU|nr:TetR/AcrR family transcriptional regulator [Actinosynnema pretiosum subsp. pretiosum]
MATSPDQRRERYMRAAVSCFARYGYRRTSMDAIAAAADVSRPALYQYYRGKEEIFREAVQWALEGFLERAEVAARGPGGVAERLTAVLGLVLRMHAGEVFQAELIDETQQRAVEQWTLFERRMIEVLEGVLGPCAGVDEVAGVLFYGVKGITLHLGGVERQEVLLRRLVELTVRGLTT